MRRNLGIIAIMLVILAAGTYFFLDQSKRPAPTEEVAITSTAPQLTSAPTDSKEVAQLRAGGSSYRDPGGLFVLLYPSDYTVMPQDSGRVAINKTGETQKEGTELYDGVSLFFEPIDLQGKTLEAWVDGYIGETTKDGTLTLTRAKAPVQIQDYPGFSFSAEGLGRYSYSAIQKDPTSTQALLITSVVVDPKNVGYEKTVQAIFSTIELLK